MGRYRKPQPWGSAYITVEGEQKLQQELHQLWKVERPQVTQAVHEAAKNGDRSENGDYIYGKKRLREIDRRVRYLEKRLDQLKVVSELPSNRHKVYFGAWVTLAVDDLASDRSTTLTYRIVGPDEFDLRQQLLSMDAPLAQQLLSKQVGDSFDWQIEGSGVEMEIIAIDYRQ